MVLIPSGILLFPPTLFSVFCFLERLGIGQQYHEKYGKFHPRLQKVLFSEVIAVHFSYLTERRALFRTRFESIF